MHPWLVPFVDFDTNKMAPPYIIHIIYLVRIIQVYTHTCARARVEVVIIIRLSEIALLYFIYPGYILYSYTLVQRAHRMMWDWLNMQKNFLNLNNAILMIGHVRGHAHSELLYRRSRGHFWAYTFSSGGKYKFSELILSSIDSSFIIFFFMLLIEDTFNALISNGELLSLLKVHLGKFLHARKINGIRETKTGIHSLGYSSNFSKSVNGLLVLKTQFWNHFFSQYICEI